MIKINPQLEAHKSTDGTVIGKAEELFPALYRGGKRFKDIVICWDEEHENIIVQTDVASESLIRLEVKYFLQAEKEKAQRELREAKIRLATIEELQDENRNQTEQKPHRTGPNGKQQKEKIMIKRQTFLSKIEDDEGNMIDFERWSCKRLSTVAANLRKLYKMSLFQRLYKGKGLHVVIYATPDGYDDLVFQETFLFDEI